MSPADAEELDVEEMTKILTRRATRAGIRESLAKDLSSIGTTLSITINIILIEARLGNADSDEVAIILPYLLCKYLAKHKYRALVRPMVISSRRARC